jgi:hypothetical protein
MVWDTIDNLWATVTDQWLWLIAAVVVLALIGAFAAYKSHKSKPHETAQHEQDGWAPTGRVDFIDPQSTGDYILQAEDTRIIDGIGGVEHREIRWRKATLDEAKTVVVAYHAQRNLATTANFIVSSPMRRRSVIDDEQQKALDDGAVRDVRVGGLE